MTHKLDTDDYFIHCIQRHSAEARLNFFLIEPAWAEHFLEYLKQGKVWPRVLLNMHSEHHQPEDLYHRLVNLAADQKAQVIDPPDQARAAFDKSRLHPRLVEAGVPVPWTVIVPHDRPEDWRFTDTERQELGSPFIIKPAMGYGRRGLVMDATSEADLARSAALWQDENYLCQRHVKPSEREGVPNYFRVFFVFGTVWLTWWNCYTDHYRMVSSAEREELGLERVEDIIRQIAALTEMQFFSSEVAQTAAGDFVVIDYVNDQCHLLSQSAHPQMGVPDELVAAIAGRIVEAVAASLRSGAKLSA